MTLPKLLVIGESGHGKDEFCKILAEQYNFRFESASRLACDLCVFDKLKIKYKYKSIDECFNDRRNHIKEWVDIIAKYNTPDKAKLAKEVMKLSDIYCGVRKRNEFNAMCDLFDIIIYIDASKRLGLAKKSYVEVAKHDANFTVYNNGSLKEFVQSTKRAYARIMQIYEAKNVQINTNTTN